VDVALSSPGAWEERFHGISPPFPHFMLIFVGGGEGEQLCAAAAAAAHGFQCTMVLEGALAEFSRGVQAQPHLTFINRDAVALLLGSAGAESLQRPLPPVRLLDVRRSDERALYGSIHGSMHIPGSLASVACVLRSGFACGQRRKLDDLNFKFMFAWSPPAAW
jgi:hypothetical protein